MVEGVLTVAGKEGGRVVATDSERVVGFAG